MNQRLRVRPVRMIAVSLMAFAPLALVAGFAGHATPLTYCTARAAAGSARAASYDPHEQCFSNQGAALASLALAPRVAGASRRPPRQAQRVPLTAALAPETSRENCIARAEPGGEAPAPPTGYRCFPTFAEAIYAATGGAVSLSPSTRPQQLTQSMLNLPGTNTVIGVDYMDANYGGASLTWYESKDINGCTDGSYYTASSMPSGWNDDVSSAISYGGCKTYNHFENTNFGGAKLTCTCATMGVMNDQTSSEKWYN